MGSTQLTGEPGYSVLERVWARPTLEVHGIAGGFTGAGAKTVIPATATAKVSMRLVPKQDPEKIVAAFKKFVQDNTPAGIQTEVRVLSAGPAIMVNPDHPAIDVAARAFRDILQAGNGVHPQRRLDSDRGRFRDAPGHSDHPDGIRPARRRIAFAQRKVQTGELLRGDHDDCPLS